jgi:hypothetical protein
VYFVLNSKSFDANPPYPFPPQKKKAVQADCRFEAVLTNLRAFEIECSSSWPATLYSHSSAKTYATARNTTRNVTTPCFWCRRLVQVVASLMHTCIFGAVVSVGRTPL